MIDDEYTRQEIEATTRYVCQLFFDGGAHFVKIVLLDRVLACTPALV
jgi:hypothetical protein